MAGGQRGQQRPARAPARRDRLPDAPTTTTRQPSSTSPCTGGPWTTSTTAWTLSRQNSTGTPRYSRRGGRPRQPRCCAARPGRYSGLRVRDAELVESQQRRRRFAAISYLACEQLGDYESRSGSLHAAVEDYTNALDWVPTELIPDSACRRQCPARGGEQQRCACLSGPRRYENRRGVGEQGAGRGPGRSGIPHDSRLHCRPGRPDRPGARYHREALDRDPVPSRPRTTSVSSRPGKARTAERRTALRQRSAPVRVTRLGWFNLGLAESRLEPSGLLASQARSPRPTHLTRRCGTGQHEMTIDASVYRTALDLSKPLPPGWSISQLQQPAPPRPWACWPS